MSSLSADITRGGPGAAHGSPCSMTRRRRHLLSQVHLSKRTKDISGAPLFCYIEKGNPGGGEGFQNLRMRTLGSRVLLQKAARRWKRGQTEAPATPAAEGPGSADGPPDSCGDHGQIDFPRASSRRAPFKQETRDDGRPRGTALPPHGPRTASLCICPGPPAPPPWRKKTLLRDAHESLICRRKIQTQRHCVLL